MKSAPHGDYVNWLANLDMAAKTWEPLLHWDYPRFLLARYPHLRPDAEDQNRDPFFRILADWDAKISEQAPEVTEGLDDEERQQLAALVLDSMVELEMQVRDSSDSKWTQSYLRFGEGWQRKLDRKAEAVRKAAESWRKEATEQSNYKIAMGEISADGSLDKLEYRRTRFIAHPDAAAAEQVLATLKTRRGGYPSPDQQATWREVIASRKRRNPASQYMVRFYWFFLHECGCTSADAEVRTAVIRNHFWKNFAPAVKYTATYTGEQTKGCSSVRLAVSRYR